MRRASGKGWTGGWRSRWAALGAAVAVTLGSGGLFVANAASSVPSSVVAITPTRILDTRTDVGLAGPFVPGVSQKLQVTGSVPTQPPPPAVAVNQVVVPSTATSVSLNVTVVGPQTGGFLSIRPGDATGTPATSNINFGAGGPNIANSVGVQLPAAGNIDIYVSGTVAQVLIDVVSYTDPATAGPAGPKGDPGPANLVPFFMYLDVGETKTIGTAGPLSIEARCLDETGGSFRSQILAKTSLADDVILVGNDSFDGSPADGFLLPTTPPDSRQLLWQNSTETFVTNDIDVGAVLTKSGHFIGVDGDTALLGVKYAGRDCVVAGTYTFRVPTATP